MRLEKEEEEAYQQFQKSMVVGDFHLNSCYDTFLVVLKMTWLHSIHMIRMVHGGKCAV